MCNKLQQFQGQKVKGRSSIFWDAEIKSAVKRGNFDNEGNIDNNTHVPIWEKLL